LAVSEFRTYSPTISARSSPARLLKPADLAVFIKQPDTIQFRDLKEGMQRLNDYLETLEKVGGIAAVLKCGRLCSLLSITHRTVKSHLRLLFERNFIAAMPSTQSEIRQMEMDRVLPRRVRIRTRSATCSSLPTPLDVPHCRNPFLPLPLPITFTELIYSYVVSLDLHFV